MLGKSVISAAILSAVFSASALAQNQFSTPSGGSVGGSAILVPKPGTVGINGAPEMTPPTATNPLEVAITSGGGGDATAANQTTQITAEQAIQTVLGTITGAAVITDANGTVQQYLRGLIKQWTAGTLVLGAGANLVGKVGIDQTTPGPAGTNNVTAGDGGQFLIAPTVQNAAYASGNCIGGFQAITVANYNGESGFMTNIRLASIGGTATPITVYVFDANPAGSTCTDKSTFTLVAADVDKLIANPTSITLAAPTGTTVAIGSIDYTPPRPFRAGGSAGSGVKTLYVGLVAGGTFTPASTTDIHGRIGAGLN